MSSLEEVNMSQRFQKDHRLAAVVMTVFLLVFGGLACGAGSKSGAAVPFPLASVHLEQNAMDKDLEVVFEATGGDEGLVELTVVAPDGRMVVDFKAPESDRFGIQHFRLESPEPKEVDLLKAAYPEGAYRFSGKAASGAEFTGQSSLSHSLPAVSTFVNPTAGAEDVPLKGLDLSWGATEAAAFYVLEIEQDQLKVNLTLRFPGNVSTFHMPDGFLVPGTEYTMLIGTVDAKENASFVETTFTTAE